MRAWMVVARVPEAEQGRLISPESLPVPMSGEITSCRFLAGQRAVMCSPQFVEDDWVN